MPYLIRRQFIFCQSCIWEGFFSLEYILSTQIYQRNIHKYFKLKNNYVLYQKTALINNIKYYLARSSPDLLPDILMEGNHKNLNYRKIIKLVNCNKKMQCRKVCWVLRCHTANKYRFPQIPNFSFSISIRKGTSWKTFVHIPCKVI